MAEASIYEIHAQGRNSLTFLDAYKAGEAFYNMRREDMPKVERFDPHPKGGLSLGIYAAMTGKSPNGYEHIFLDADDKFRAGYEAARARQPDKAVSILDAQQPSQQPAQGQTMPDQQAPASQQPAANREPERLKIDGQEVGRMDYSKTITALGPRFEISAFRHNGEQIKTDKHVVPEMIAESYGKAVADRINNAPSKVKSDRIVGADLYGPATADKAGLPRVGGDLDRVNDVQVNGADVGRVAFARTELPTGPVYDLKVYGTQDQLLSDQRGIPPAFVAEKLGTRIAEAVLNQPGQQGVVPAQVINELGRVESRPVQRSNAFYVPLVQQQAPQPQVQPQEAAAAPRQEPAPRDVQATPVPAATKAPVQQPSAQQVVLNTLDLVAERQPEKAPAAQQQAEPPKGPTREQLRASLEQRFEVASVGTLLKPADEYRFKGDGPLRIAFTDHGKQLSTSLDTKEVVKGMADLAQAKGWREIVANGTPEFKRSMWMEGNLRGIHVAGFSPSKEDHERLKAARAELAQQQPKAQPAKAPEQPMNTVEAGPTRQPEKQQEKSQKPVQAAAPAKQPAKAKEAAPAQAQGSSRAQYLMAAKSVLTEQGLDAKTVERAMEGLGRRIDGMLAAGQTLPKLHVFDRAAPSLQPVPTVTVQPTLQPGREVAAPGR